jgi:hypothetical protein
LCNPRVGRAPDARPFGAGTLDAVCRGMKDLLFVAVTIVFFSMSWLYAKSFDHL